MKKTYLLGGGIAVLTAAILGGCNGNDQDTTTTTPTTQQLTITPSLGKILTAKVIARTAAGTVLGKGDINNTGSAILNITPTSAPIIVEVQVPAGAQYFDEAKQANATVDTAKSFHSVMPTFQSNVGVTPLTDLAYQAAINAAGNESSLTSATINQANQQIGETLGKGLPNILIPPALIADSNLDNTIKVKSDANSYALLLAALAKLGSGNTPMLDAIAKLSLDMKDGAFDGKDATAVGAPISYNLNSAIDLQAALQAYFKAIAQASATLKALYPDASLTAFRPDLGKPISLINLGTGKFGSLLDSLVDGGEVTNHIPTAVTVSDSGSITTAKWTEQNASFTLMFNKTTGVVQSVKVEDGSPTFLQCHTTNCAGLTVNLAAKTVTAVNFMVAENTVPNTAILKFNGILRFGTPTIDPTQTDVATCGSIPALTMSALAPLAKTYTVKIYKDDANVPPGQSLPVVKSGVSLVLAANGTVTLDGKSAMVQAVCNNGNSGKDVLVFLDKITGSFTNSAGQLVKTHASIDFFANGDTNGEDFNNTSSTYQFFNNTP